MIASETFIRKYLPGGAIPNDDALGFDEAETPVLVPFAVMRWDSGLDYNLDGSSYQDSQPDWELAGAFDCREDADRFAAKLTAQGEDAAVNENTRFPLYAFTYAHVPR